MPEKIDYSLKKALLVEDNEMNVMLFSLLLKRVGIQFEVATDGEKAYNFFLANTYNIILTDINLPKLTGDDMARLIRKDSNTSKANIPIIALTASILTSETDTYIDAGINEVLIKPFTEEKFKDVISRHIC